MNIFHAIILGLIQGITEFLPISSSAHLVLIPKLFGWGESPLVFDTSLHLGTALAVLIYFYKDFLKLNKQMLTYLMVGSLPVMIAGFLLDKFAENLFRGLFWIFISLLLGTIIMAGAEYFYRLHREKKGLTFTSALVMGLVQPLALMPGVSRSGVTISGGLFSSLSRENAAKLSFLLSTPAVVAAGGYKLLTTFSDIKTIGYTPWLTGILVSFVSGIVAISFLLRYLKNKSLNLFIVYRLVVALVVFFLLR